jgi:integrase
MATVRRRDGKWQAQVRRRGHTKSRTFLQRADAQKWAKQTELEIDRLGLQPRATTIEKQSVAAIVEWFRDAILPSRPNRKNEEIVLNAFLRHKISKLSLAALTSQQVKAYRDVRLGTIKLATIKREFSLFHRVFELARTDGRMPLDANPFKGVTATKTDFARDRRLSDGDQKALFEALGKCRNRLLGGVIRFAIATGMRRGELLNARWKDLHWDLATLHIPLTKTGHPRTIPLTTEAKQVLVELAIVWTGSDSIFPTTARAIALVWKRLTKRAGIVDLHFHDLRHEAVSRFFEKGLSIPEVALISGHKDPRMLFRSPPPPWSSDCGGVFFRGVTVRRRG